VAFAPVALALVLAVRIFDRRKLLTQSPQPYGQASSGWLLPASATAIGVLSAATVVEIFNLGESQWMIWSAASVVVGDLATSTHKLKLRALGAVVGVPLGLLTGHWLPASRDGYSFALLGATLTLVAFDRYVVGFGARFFLAIAAAFTGGAGGMVKTGDRQDDTYIFMVRR
jgi:uncharacterized membrane protein YccC